ncbi:hypothetical protein [Pseudomonas oryzicola]|uniref:Lipoprotein n=1 Tax=Pseudomonas oryzicola TaxID=485876 RepID=A0ABS6QGM7_9PSED|nr:hypothetical protein [Pseudomonas oryzicola]MBV4493354.1 hypothetical protein [Pseudomonas oryzicola]
MQIKLKVATAVLISLSLFGCGSEEEQNASAPQTHAKTYEITLPGGDTLNASGDSFKAYEQDSPNGKVKNYEIYTKSVAKAAENSVYMQLKELGFKRSVMEDSAKQYKIHYKKDGVSTIGAIYIENGESSAPTTKMKMYFSES